jgi:hypothetical protein
MTAALHTGKAVGDRATLSKIQQAKNNDTFYQDMDPDKCKEAIDELLAFREGKRSNPRVTNKGAACDVFTSMEKLESEVRLPGLPSI